MSRTATLTSQIIRCSRSTVLKANYVLRRYNDVVWLIGDGRSGTTWLSDLMNHANRYRTMFEPFHPRFVDAVAFLSPHEYIRPCDPHGQLAAAASAIFSGRFPHPRVDSGNRSLVYNGLLIKDIHSPRGTPVLMLPTDARRAHTQRAALFSERPT